MLSMKAKYGLKAMLRLARSFGQGPVLIADLAMEEGIPKKFLELILLELKQQGVLHSKKGQPVVSILTNKMSVVRYEVWDDLSDADLYFVKLKRADGTVAGVFGVRSPPEPTSY